MSQDLQKKQDLARQMRFSRSKFRRINSLDLIPEDPSLENGDDDSSESSLSSSPPTSPLPRSDSARDKALLKESLSPPQAVVQKIIFFIPQLLITLSLTFLRFLLYVPLSIAAPSFWLSALLWLFWKFMRVPVGLVKWVLSMNDTAVNQGSGKKRTVLISCGSTIQSLHLARNFYSPETRVIVFEFEGLFGLCRFSTAVDKFYVVPRPTQQNVDSYTAALCHIVKRENVSVYIPVCATSPAYYDAIAKPHLELLGCATFIPGLQETIVLDDCLQFYQKCESQSIPLPPHAVVSSPPDLAHLYDSGFISNFRNILMAVGMQGLLERFKYILPNSRRDFKFSHDISERQQWMVVRDLPGEHYVTCTTVRDSRVVANVTCKIEARSRNLVPVTSLGSASSRNTPMTSDEAIIDRWLRNFFAKVRFQRSINGHISFRMVKSQATGQLLPLGVRLGVALPYICYNRSHAQVICRTMCVHMKQLNFSTTEEESALSALSASWRWSTIERSSATAALDKREALFAYWDPLPYCAYYHFQLPLESVKMFLQKRHRPTTKKSLSPRISMPVH